MYVQSVSDNMFDIVLQKDLEVNVSPLSNGRSSSPNIPLSKQNETYANRLLHQLNETSKNHNETITNTSAKKIRFLVDPDSGRMAIKVLDRTTDEVIREIPPENVLNILDKLRDTMTHVFDQKA